MYSNKIFAHNHHSGMFKSCPIVLKRICTSAREKGVGAGGVLSVSAAAPYSPSAVLRSAVPLKLPLRCRKMGELKESNEELTRTLWDMRHSLSIDIL